MKRQKAPANGVSWRRSRWSCVALILLAGACVDEKIEGVSTSLLIPDASETVLAPGAKTKLAFQAVDAEGKGVPDQNLELVITSLDRLTFEAEPSTNHRVVTTSRAETFGGAILSGAAIVEFVVPNRASEGEVTIVASLEGKRGADPKTRWHTFTIAGEAIPIGGAGGEGGSGGSGAGSTTGGLGGTGWDLGGSAGQPTNAAGEGG